MNHFSTFTLIAVSSLLATGAGAGTVTPVLKINFDGSISGDTYTLGVGEIDTTGTFAGFNSPVVAGGEADLIGGGTHEGVGMNPGAIVGQNWIAEAVLNFDTLSDSLATAISVQGDAGVRINTAGTQLEAYYWDGLTEGRVTTALPAADTPVHLALVWDAAATSLTAYVDGVSIGVIDNNAYAVTDATDLSFGYFGRIGFNDRGIDGQLDAVSFSTFTGTFDPNTDLQIPEPGSLALLSLGGLFVLRRRRGA